MKALQKGVNNEARAKEIAKMALELIPIKLPHLMQRAFSFRANALLLPRDFQFFYSNTGTSELIQASLIRLWTAELINLAGIKKFGKTPEYNRAKLAVRAAIIRHLKANPELQNQFEGIAERRAQKSFFARARKALGRVK